jgi:hypothetical protein
MSPSCYYHHIAHLTQSAKASTKTISPPITDCRGKFDPTMSSRTQQAQADEQRSPLLDLPAELRLMVYEEHYEIVYRPLQTKEFVAFLGRCSWPTHTIPSGLAIGNRQLFDELQAVLLRVRDADEPDILFPFHASSSNTISNHHLLSANILDSKKTPMEDEARLTSIVERFVADQRIVVVPQQQYTRQEVSFSYTICM